MKLHQTQCAEISALRLDIPISLGITQAHHKPTTLYKCHQVLAPHMHYAGKIWAWSGRT